MIYGLMGLMVTLIVAADQISKYFTVHSMALYQTKSFIPGIVELKYVQNEGMAWSLLSGARWFFVAMTAVFLVLVVLAIRKKMVSKPFELFCVAAIVGGGIGNLIDRIVNGYVVDMLNFTFMDFPVFNVADCFVSCGCVLLVLFVLFFDEDKKEENQ